jgi:hypothetical protein
LLLREADPWLAGSGDRQVLAPIEAPQRGGQVGPEPPAPQPAQAVHRVAADTGGPAPRQPAHAQEQLAPPGDALGGGRLVGDLHPGELRALQRGFRLDQVQQLLGGVAGHAVRGGHGHPAGLPDQPGGGGVAGVDDGLGVDDGPGQPGPALAGGDALEVAAGEPAPADGVAAGAALLEEVGALLGGQGRARARASSRPPAVIPRRGRVGLTTPRADTFPVGGPGVRTALPSVPVQALAPAGAGSAWAAAADSTTSKKCCQAGG